MDRYDQFFNVQVGGGGGGRGIGRIYVGTPNQRGHGGIGSFLAGMFRRVLPLLSRGAKAVGKEALRTGMNIISDVANTDTSVKESFRNRMKESGKNLKRKVDEKFDNLMEGAGHSSSRRMINLQSLIRSRCANSSVSQKRVKKKKKPTKRVKRLNHTKKQKPKKSEKKKKNRKKQNKRRTTRDIFD